MYRPDASRVAGASYIKLAADLAGYTSSLPIMVIENFGAGTIPQKGWNGTGAGIKQVPRQTAVWATFERSAGVSALTNAPQMFSDIGIRGRGAFSSTWRQKPYSVEAVDADRCRAEGLAAGDARACGLGALLPGSRDQKDPSLLFNTFAYDLSRETWGIMRCGFAGWKRLLTRMAATCDSRIAAASTRSWKRSRGARTASILAALRRWRHWKLAAQLNRMDPEPETGWPAENGATQPLVLSYRGAQSDSANAAECGFVVPGDDVPQQSNGFLNFDNPNGYTINTNQRAAIENWFKQLRGCALE